MGKGKGNADCHSSTLLQQELPQTWNSDELHVEYVDTPEALAECLAVIRHPQVERIGLDIETTGGLKPWMGTTRLIQVGVELPEPRQFLIDCWAIDPAPIFPVLEDPTVEIITCNGKYEQTHLHYRYGVVLTNLYDVCYVSRVITAQKNESARDAQRQAVREAEKPFMREMRELKRKLEDTEPGAEHEALEEQIEELQQKLKAARDTARAESPSPRKIGNDFRRLMRRYVGKQISKTQQTSAWDAPVLSEHQLRYAAMDVAGLLDIRRGIGRDAEGRGLVEEADKVNAAVLDSSLHELEGADLGAVEYTRMGRAMTHCSSLEQLERLYGMRGQMTLHHSFRARLEALYQRRRSELGG